MGGLDFSAPGGVEPGKVVKGEERAQELAATFTKRFARGGPSSLRRARDPVDLSQENAGAGAARLAIERLRASHGRAVGVCGHGRNGGDAMVVARHLAIEGISVELAMVNPALETLRGDTAIQSEICRALGIPSFVISDLDGAITAGSRFRGCDLIVDGLYGTGLSRPVRGVEAAVIESVNSSGAAVLALDVPSGLDCDSGEPLGACVRALVTVSFGAPKLGFANPAARTYTGDVFVVSIGAPVKWPLG